MAADIQREADELVRYYSELGRRLTQTGVRGVADLLALHEQLCRALEAVTPQEITWAVEQAERLIDELVQIDAKLRALKTLKTALGRTAPADG
jgi:hypothetical protein